MSGANLIYGLDRRITTIGSLGIGTVKDEGRIRFVIEDAGFANVIRVRARIVGQIGWDNLADLTGNVSQTVDVFTYDQVEVIVLVYSSTAPEGVKLSASSFDGSVINFYVPNGDDIENAQGVVFTSSDNSVIITGNSLTGEIDFVAVGGGGGSSTPYTQSFDSGDWVLNVDSYELSVLESTHGKGSSPIVEVFELVGDYAEVETGINISGAGDIVIQINSSPDLRFSGKYVIN